MRANVRILIVDSDERLCEAVRTRLRRDGCEIVVVHDAEQALDSFRRRPFPLVVSDVALPGAGGIELLDSIKRLRPDTFVVLMTSTPNLEAAVGALRNGAFDFVDRPVGDVEALARVVDRAIGRWIAELQERERIARLQTVANRLWEANAALRDMADHDGLTGLFNHRYFREVLENEIARCRRYGRIFSLLFVDVDEFKTYNDTHGHLAGDALLRDLAKFLLRASRQSDIVARYGGDEFVLLLPETPPEGARVFAERLRRDCAEVTLSIGFCSFPLHGDEALRLLDRADRALYGAKRAGRNCVSGWSTAEEETVGVGVNPSEAPPPPEGSSRR